MFTNFNRFFVKYNVIITFARPDLNHRILKCFNLTVDTCYCLGNDDVVCLKITFNFVLNFWILLKLDGCYCNSYNKLHYTYSTFLNTISSHS